MFLEANDGFAFATTTNESAKKNKGKKKKITSYKCKQEVNYLNECPEEEEDKLEKGTYNNKKGTSLLMKTRKSDESDKSVKRLCFRYIRYVKFTTISR